MRHNIFIAITSLMCLFLLIFCGYAGAANYSSWNEIVDQMHIALDNAGDAYEKGDADAGKNFVNDAYFGYYEKEGVERTVMSFISGKRATTVEYQFSVIKGKMTQGAPVGEVRDALDNLKTMLREDANILDGSEDPADSSWSDIVDQMYIALDNAGDAYARGDADAGKGFVDEVRDALDTLKTVLSEDATGEGGSRSAQGAGSTGLFMASLLIILREGFEAILVIAAIAAYLIRSGNANQTRVVYGSGIAALVASGIAAVAMQSLFEISGTANQEILEGAAMLLAVVVLFFVSNWMVSKAEAEAWKHYIEGKVQSAVETGSSFALGAAAFLAVFREGAETILFYQALLGRVEGSSSMVWLGFLVGCAALVVIFALVRYGSLAIPIKPFFMGTSILMYIMSIAFAGGGVKELQEAGVIGVTMLNFEPIDILGIYPTIETLAPQIVLLLLAVVSIFHYRAKARRARSAA
ncbi:MAG: FTR1 family iron permease [Synergistaceae bacterium]|nr:FTR1 family iron permease [Synergistaceae bacterium]